MDQQFKQNILKYSILFFIIYHPLLVQAQCWSSAMASINFQFAIKKDSTLWGFGDNSHFAFGDIITQQQIYTPIQITTKKWLSMSTNYENTMGIQSNGTLWAKWDNSNMDLGLPIGYIAHNFAQVGVDSDWLQAETGGGGSICLKKNGTLWVTGNNQIGELGLGHKNPQLGFIQNGTDSDWQKIAYNRSHLVALKKNGTLWTCGANTYLQIGDTSNTTYGYRTVLQQIGNDSDWVFISAFDHTLAIKKNGTLWGWGKNDSYQLGGNCTMPATRYPTQIGTDSNWVYACAGEWNSFAIKKDGSLWACGAGSVIGNGTSNSSKNFIQLGLGIKWASVSNDDIDEAAAITTSGELYTWGDNGWGGLGLGDSTILSKFIPTMVGNFCAPLALVETPKKEAFSVYPNPTNNSIIIVATNKNNIKIIDVYGKIVKEFTMQNDKEKIDISSFSNGIYFIKCMDKCIRFIKTNE